MNKSELKKIDQIRQEGFRPVVVGCFVNSQKVLMVYKKEYDLWFLPQGGIENNENYKEALQREMSEELGADFMNNCQQEFAYLTEAVVNFPPESQGSRDLQTDFGQTVRMKGKKYFFYVIKTDKPDLKINKTEFDDYSWVDYKHGLDFAEKIYQKGKKRITKQVLDSLKNNKYIY